MRVNTRLYINFRSGTFHVRVQELCESRGGRPGLSVLMSLTVSVDVKQHWTVLRHWSQFVPNMSTDIRGHEALHHHLSCIWIFIHTALLSVHNGMWLGQWIRTTRHLINCCVFLFYLRIRIPSRMYLCWSLCTLCLLAFQVRVIVGDSGLCCNVCVTSFERWLPPFCVDSSHLTGRQH